MMTPKQINQQNNQGLTALMLAATGQMPSHPEIVRMLVEAEKKQGSDLGLSMTDRFGNSVLHYAAAGFEESPPDIQARKIEIFKYLVNEGADPLLSNKKNQTPFDLGGTSFNIV